MNTYSPCKTAVTRFISITLLCLFFATAGNAFTPKEVLSLNAVDVETSLNLNSTIVYIEDEDDHYTFDDILNGRYTDPLQQQAGTNFNIGISDSTYWFFFKLNHFSRATTKALTRYIEISYPPLDHIDFYTYNYNTQEKTNYISGDNEYFGDRPIAHNFHLFPIDIDHNEEVFVAIRVKSKGSLRIPIKIWDPVAFHASNQTFLVFMGMYFGIMLLMFFYNSCIYVATRDKSYLHYLAYVGSFGMFQALMTGFAGAYLWPNTPILNDKLLNAFVLLICVSGISFVRSLLDLKAHMPRMDTHLKRFVFINLWIIPLTLFLPYVPTLKYSILVGIGTAAVCLVVGIQLSLRGLRTAHFFIAAWFCLLVAAIIMGMVTAGLIPANIFTTNALLVGSAIEASLLSLTLADRMNSIQKERAQAQENEKQALQKANELLQETNKNKDEFLATISHELRTPMNGVLNCIAHMQDEQSETKRRNFMGLAEQSANHMMLLVDSVLSYAELQANRFVLNKDLFSTQWLMDEIQNTYAKACQDKGINFNVEIKDDVPKYLFGDATKILQVLNNLTDNAIKFTEKGFVNVVLDVEAINKKQQQVDLVFTVEDSGIGIPPGSESIIFSKFKQLDGSNTRSYGGLGIGLTVCQKIAEQMKARIEFDSTLGEGSKFSFYISLQYSVQPKESDEQEARRKYPLETLAKDKRALVAEDNAVNAAILKAMLEKLGMRVDVAINGKAALEIVNSKPVDIVLMDCQMPEMDGLEATRKIRESGGEKGLVPIIAVTANATSADRNKCIEAGMNDYLAKPLSRSELMEKLTQWLPIDHKGDDSDSSNVTPLTPRVS